jgi:hypothetical protein
MDRCFEIAGREMSKGSASSVTEDTPLDNLSRIARLTGLERAEKTRSRLDEAFDSPPCGEDSCTTAADLFVDAALFLDKATKLFQKPNI